MPNKDSSAEEASQKVHAALESFHCALHGAQESLQVVRNAADAAEANISRVNVSQSFQAATTVLDRLRKSNYTAVDVNSPEMVDRIAEALKNNTHMQQSLADCFYRRFGVVAEQDKVQDPVREALKKQAFSRFPNVDERVLLGPCWEEYPCFKLLRDGPLHLLDTNCTQVSGHTAIAFAVAWYKLVEWVPFVTETDGPALDKDEPKFPCARFFCPPHSCAGELPRATRCPFSHQPWIMRRFIETYFSRTDLNEYPLDIMLQLIQRAPVPDGNSQRQGPSTPRETPHFDPTADDERLARRLQHGLRPSPRRGTTASTPPRRKLPTVHVPRSFSSPSARLRPKPFMLPPHLRASMCNVTSESFGPSSSPPTNSEAARRHADLAADQRSSSPASVGPPSSPTASNQGATRDASLPATGPSSPPPATQAHDGPTRKSTPSSGRTPTRTTTPVKRAPSRSPSVSSDSSAGSAGTIKAVEDEEGKKKRQAARARKEQGKGKKFKGGGGGDGVGS